eukprot:TRINITY_DN15269_c2_g1_i1.p2 TRINITY_DN15269_c2_g1~~TRINITY_DN15269_c2_g1_i1.p2  ORF type:complete len:198 (+),score=7.39 TRINITY_DN15269_c2_g1_i1:424-1017(+)
MSQKYIKVSQCMQTTNFLIIVLVTPKQKNPSRNFEKSKFLNDSRNFSIFRILRVCFWQYILNQCTKTFSQVQKQQFVYFPVFFLQTLKVLLKRTKFTNLGSKKNWSIYWFPKSSYLYIQQKKNGQLIGSPKVHIYIYVLQNEKLSKFQKRKEKFTFQNLPKKGKQKLSKLSNFFFGRRHASQIDLVVHRQNNSAKKN